ncbi:MAG: dihydroorotate dehydrogenase [Firmicutes bacterium]|nr:dihydroorotate dehydrogenase [Bacillota bacterium]MBO2520211.1 dihydroorotate dehydrogenase [Bacillota bacterium]
MHDAAGNAVDLSVQLGGLTLKNPVLVASGTFGYGREFAGFFDLGLLGGVMVKGISLEPWEGNPLPRMVETPAGMLNAIGLQNPGVEHYLKHDLPFLRSYDTRIIVNVIGRTVEEYARVVARIEAEDGADAYELNISCPNVKEGGIAFGSDPAMAAQVVAAVRAETERPVIPKLSPNVTSVAAVAAACREAGADAVSLVNTFLAMAIDVDAERPILANGFGGLSGPAIRPIAVRMVWEVYREVDLPIIGMGGIMTARDALEFILAGASAVAVGTANFVNPYAAVEVLRGIEDAVRRRGPLAEMIGRAHRR